VQDIEFMDFTDKQNPEFKVFQTKVVNICSYTHCKGYRIKLIKKKALVESGKQAPVMKLRPALVVGGKTNFVEFIL
jgi:hypothetical protein